MQKYCLHIPIDFLVKRGFSLDCRILCVGIHK